MQPTAVPAHQKERHASAGADVYVRLVHLECEVICSTDGVCCGVIVECEQVVDPFALDRSLKLNDASGQFAEDGFITLYGQKHFDAGFTFATGDGFDKLQGVLQ